MRIKLVLSWSMQICFGRVPLPWWTIISALHWWWLFIIMVQVFNSKATYSELTNSILLNKVSQCDSNSTQSSSLNSEMVEPPAPGLISSRLASDQYICIMLLYSFELISPCYPVDRNNLHTDLLGLPPCGWAAMFKDHMGHLFVERLRYL